jgi:hypothetical protein
VATRDTFMAHVCRVVRLFPCKVISPSPNVVISTSYYCDDNFMDGDDYFVVMVYINHYIDLVPLHA